MTLFLSPTARKLPDKPRARRRALYAKVQHSWRNNRGRCAKEVLSGTWGGDEVLLAMAAQEPYWRSIFSKWSVPDRRTPDPVGPTQWGIMAPITSDDVKRTLAGMKDGAPGPDGRRPKDLKNIPIQELVAHYNLWLLAGYQPEALRRSETVLLPKEPGNKKPEVIRCFHRMLAKRNENLLPFNSGQKAFMATDGVAESVWFLSSVINQHKADLQPINIAFVDVTKAFDSVSHHSLLIAAERLGVPPPFLTYLSSLYGGAQTVLRIGPQRSLKLDLSWLWC